MADPTRKVALVSVDVADEEADFVVVEAVKQRFGRLDALVNNAGIATFKTLLETTPAWSGFRSD